MNARVPVFEKMFSSSVKMAFRKEFLSKKVGTVRLCTYADGYDIYADRKRTVVLIDGVRSPFVHSLSHYKDVDAYYLQRHVLMALMKKTGLPKEMIEYVVVGQTSQDIRCTNVAAAAVQSAGFPETIPSHTVVQGCISSNQAIATACNMLMVGAHDLVIAGGVEVYCDVPFRMNRTLARLLYQIYTSKTNAQRLNFIKQIRLKHFKLQLPSVTEFTTEENVGHFSDRLAAAFQVSRKEQDEFSIRSHTLAHKARNEGHLAEVTPFWIPGTENTVMEDQGIRLSSMDKLASLKPSFTTPHGTVTAGNSSFFSDGASACILATEEKALSLGLKPKAYIRDNVHVSMDPKDQLLLGPAYAVPKVLSRGNLQMKNIDVFEFHEAFAAQILANFKAMDSDWFSRNYIGLKEKPGYPPMEKTNLWGGSIALGHPFGATGVRLLTTAANRLHEEDGQFALISACAAGGLGHAMIVERYPA